MGSDHVLFSKNVISVGKGYCNDDGMFKLNLDRINEMNDVSFMDSLSLCHARLAH